MRAGKGGEGKTRLAPWERLIRALAWRESCFRFIRFHGRLVMTFIVLSS